ncbi:Valine--tRNA ligase [Rhodobacteraceae bacterium THAF1]|uniref:valine--tRNA ligase n=1 Tax=Palleronia sp. THAF1 TaxID=2587842 RepID=UPI000F41029E|nr:valine--tRNA ligase [Palleronia sp. THAF1]QFU09041.1 Valine--tRNA ligase [Palleronia sp. THAF1]VDC24179.1 Valine--tRNA ligase [Rhodobacteraceae bacterium THAF1]
MPMEKNFDAQSAEPRLYEMWEQQGCFAAGANAKDGAETFSIMIPPPNVTGSLHMGHAFNNTLQDILIRWKRMQGYDTLWQPGTDHAGIATQMVTEREMAANGEPTRTEMGREAFLNRVWQQKQSSRGTIIGQLKRLGASCDWSREAFTMGGAPGDPDAREGGQDFHAAVIKTFVEFYEKGIIYRGKRLVNWDPHFETAISDLEVENIDQPGHMWHFKYPLQDGATYTYIEKDDDGNVLFEEERDYISIATTRPETMLGDGAVAVHTSDERYAPIVGKLCEIPVGPKEHRRLIPIITDDYPDPTFGSGAVKITGAHDFNDYGVATRNGIPLYALMDTRAKMRSDGLPYAEAAEMAGAIARGEIDAPADATQINLVPEEYRGLDRFDARQKVIDAITSEGLAVMVPDTDPRLGAQAAKAPIAPEEGGETREAEMIPLVEAKTITQPFGDRSKVVIEPMLTDQWFVDTDQIVGPALEAVREGMARADGTTDGTKILPERDAKTYFHWLENIEPWCISRQLWWGHRVPVWYGPYITEGGERLHDTTGAAPKEAAVFLRDGQWVRAFCGADSNAVREDAQNWYRARLHGRVEIDMGDGVLPHAEELSSEVVQLSQDEDVLDTWFSSGLWPLGTLGWPDDSPELQKYFPTSVLITGFDIIFFWVARMMMMQFAMVEQKPFHTVYVHALVRDEKGRKMSKSLGNVIDPLTLIDQYGADAVRFTLSSMAAMGRDLKLSEQRVAGYRNFGTKLWNAFRFAEMNGALAETGGDLPHDLTQATNKWIVGETARTVQAVDAALSDYRFNDASSTLYAFVWGQVCDWYVELAKPLFDNEDTAPETRRTLAWVLDQCCILLHPFMPFITEELWGQTERDSPLVHAAWPTYGPEVADENADAEMSWVIALIEQIRSVRGEMNVPASLKAPLLMIELDEAGRTAFARNRSLIERLARLGEIAEGPAPKGAMILPVRGGSFALPLADIIDVQAEKARIDKALAKLGKEIGGLEGRLKNPKFKASAKPEVVEETEANLAARTAERDRMAEAQARLAEL